MLIADMSLDTKPMGLNKIATQSYPVAVESLMNGKENGYF
jgi:hypothetical protein